MYLDNLPDNITEADIDTNFGYTKKEEMNMREYLVTWLGTKEYLENGLPSKHIYHLHLNNNSKNNKKVFALGADTYVKEEDLAEFLGVEYGIFLEENPTDPKQAINSALNIISLVDDWGLVNSLDYVGHEHY